MFKLTKVTKSYGHIELDHMVFQELLTFSPCLDSDNPDYFPTYYIQTLNTLRQLLKWPIYTVVAGPVLNPINNNIINLDNSVIAVQPKIILTKNGLVARISLQSKHEPLLPQNIILTSDSLVTLALLTQEVYQNQA